MRARLSPRDYATDQGGGKRRGVRSHADVSALLPMCFPTRFSGKQIRLKSLISLAHPDTRPHNPQKQTSGCPLCAKSGLMQCSKNRYSITSFARERSDGGTVRPSAFAVLRLMASSYLVGA